MNRLPPDHPNSRIHRERDFNALSRLALLLFLGLALSGGFLFAARQHIAALEYGYKSEELRREQQRLLAEQRRLMLAKEQASSPARLEPAAREIGLLPIAPGQVGIRNEEQRNELHPAVIINPAPTLRR
ncbi:MAG TPA: hypothetical protein VN920_02060 [Pyrinomonadaceae bacterium]|nr:hypothetical protein [Pyrinomonadaceae bacterium]